MLNKNSFIFPKNKNFLNNYLNNLPENFCEAHFDIREELEAGLYLLKNGDIGAIYKINGIYDEPLTNNDLEQRIHALQKGLRAILVGIPSHESTGNSVVSVHFSQRRVLSGISNQISDGIKSIIDTEEAFLYKSQNIVKKEIFLSIRYVLKSEDQGFKDKIFFITKNENKTVKNDYEKHLKFFKQEISNLEHNISRYFHISPLPSYDLIYFTQNLLSGGENHCAISSNSNIHENVYVKKVSQEEHRLKIGGSEKGLFYLEHLPEEFNYGQMRLFIDHLPCTNFDIIWTLSHGSNKFGTDLIAKEGWYSGKATRIREAEEFQSFRENINSTSPYGVQSLKIITHNLEQDKFGALQSLSMDYLGSRLQEEKQIPIHFLRTILPLSCLPEENKMKGRARKIRLENALAFCPIFVGPLTKGHQLWISRSMTEAKFDLFAGQGNKMTALLAMSRGGKSVFNTKLLMEFMARNPDGIVRVIDKKSSYQKLSDIVNGRVIYFSEDSLKKNPYSPFALDSWDEDDIENLYLLISTALVQKNDGIKLTACHSEILREALKLSFNNHLKNKENATKQGLLFDPHPVWNDVLSQMPTACENLKSSGVRDVDSAKDDLSKWSVNLYETGQYGFIFSNYEKNEQRSLDQFLTYDLDGISDPVLAQLAAMMAFIKIGRDLAKLPRSTPKLIVFEELGMLLHGDGDSQKLMDEFIHMVIKTCAKLNAQAISITNDVKDFTEKAAGRTIWGNSTQKIFLPLGDLYPMAERAWHDQFNEADLQIMKSLQKEFHLKRSQAYIYSNNEVCPFKGSLIIPLSPYMNAICTTSGDEVEFYNNQIKNGASPLDTLKEMAEKHPYGEGL
jgi:hypothetical protein